MASTNTLSSLQLEELTTKFFVESFLKGDVQRPHNVGQGAGHTTATAQLVVEKHEQMHARHLTETFKSIAELHTFTCISQSLLELESVICTSQRG